MDFPSQSAWLADPSEMELYQQPDWSGSPVYAEHKQLIDHLRSSDWEDDNREHLAALVSIYLGVDISPFVCG